LTWGERCSGALGVGAGQRQAAVRSLLVVVANVAAQQPQQMAPAKNQRPVKALRSHGLGPTSRPDRRLADGGWSGTIGSVG
jgi:hypothetical protein